MKGKKLFLLSYVDEATFYLEIFLKYWDKTLKLDSLFFLSLFLLYISKIWFEVQPVFFYSAFPLISKLVRPTEVKNMSNLSKMKKAHNF